MAVKCACSRKTTQNLARVSRDALISQTLGREWVGNLDDVGDHFTHMRLNLLRVRHHMFKRSKNFILLNT